MSGRARALALPAALVVGLVAAAWLLREPLERLFGPPRVVMREVYERRPGVPRIEHGTFDRVLARFVDERGLVDYAGLAAAPEELDRYLEELAAAPVAELGRDELLALLVNAYNAFTLRLVLDHRPLESIRDIPAAERWDARRWRLGPHVVSLTELEHDWLRARFVEPRIHFAIVCASRGCPPLARGAYSGPAVETQLEGQASVTHADGRLARYDATAGVLALTQVYRWYAGDFEQVAGSVATYAARWLPALRRDLAAGPTPRVEWLPWDWSLNERTAAAEK